MEQVAGNLIELSGPALERGRLTGLVWAGGGLCLAEGADQGEFVSQEMQTEGFDRLVASWNSGTPDGAWVEVSARVRLDEGPWSQWLSWGKWGLTIRRASVNGGCGLAELDTDVLSVKDGAANRVQLKAELRRGAGGSPSLRRVCATLRGPAPLAAPAVCPPNRQVVLGAPVYSQMTRDPDIGRVICSATTIAVLLGDRGEDPLPEEVAGCDFDFRYQGYGNWSYSVAAAGEYGYHSYVQYGDFDLLVRELDRGWSVGMSVSYSASPQGKFPYLEHGAANNTAGHLIAITGYERVDGQLYFYSSDSAATGDLRCARRYRADQLDRAWRGRILYIVHEKERDARETAPRRVPAALEERDGAYRLMADGQPVALPADFITGKKQRVGCGAVGYVIEDRQSPIPTGARRTLANQAFRYAGVTVAEDGALLLDRTVLLRAVRPGQRVCVRFYVMDNRGITYIAPLFLQKSADEPYEMDDLDLEYRE